MAKYFTISNGLRGCYMLDSCSTFKVSTRRELKAIVESEASYQHGAGLSKKAIASFVAAVWRESNKRSPSYLPHCLPIKPDGAQEYSYGIFGSVATRQEFLDNQEMIN